MGKPLVSGAEKTHTFVSLTYQDGFGSQHPKIIATVATKSICYTPP